VRDHHYFNLHPRSHLHPFRLKHQKEIHQLQFSEFFREKTKLSSFQQ
jgi:hypothetical protein